MLNWYCYVVYIKNELLVFIIIENHVNFLKSKGCCYDINEKPCLILFMDKDCYDGDYKTRKMAILSEVAEAMRESVSFFYAKEKGDVSDQIRGMIQNEDCPLLSIVDIVDNGGYYQSS